MPTSTTRDTRRGRGTGRRVVLPGGTLLTGDAANRYGRSSSSAPESPATPPYNPANPIATSKVRRYTGRKTLGVNPVDIATADAYSEKNRQRAEQAARNRARSEALRAVQGSISAVEGVYSDLVSRQKITNTDALGRTRATAARSGVLGSDFGNADITKTTEAGDRAIQVLENAKAEKVAAILAGVESDAEARAQAEIGRINETTEQRIAGLKDRADRATAQLKALAEAGGELEELTDREYNHLLEATGYTPEQLKNAFVLNTSKENILSGEVQGNKYIQVTQDPITKKIKSNVVDLGFDVPQGYSVQKLDNGQLVFYPSKIDPSKPIGSQILTYGVAGPGKGKTYKSGSFSYTDDDVGQANETLESVRGEDKYVYTPTYLGLLENWENAGGTAEDFFKKFNPIYYLNPYDASVPAYIRAKLPKVKTSREL